MEAKLKAKEMYLNNVRLLAQYIILDKTSKELAYELSLISIKEILKVDSLANEELNYLEYRNDNSQFVSYWKDVRHLIELEIARL